MERGREEYGLSERHAGRLLGQGRGTQRYAPILRSDEEGLRRAIITLASQYGRYGYRRISALIRSVGWQVGKDRGQRMWRREGLQVPQEQKPRGRLWLNDSSCVRLRPERAKQVWSYDFVSAVTHDGRTLRLLTLLDEFTRECVAIRVAAKTGQPRSDRDAGGGDGVPGDSRVSALRQWPGVHRPGTAEVAGELRNRNAVYRTGKSVGKRLLREFPWEATG